MLLVQAPIGQELDPLELLQQHEVDIGNCVAYEVLAVATLGLEHLHESLHLLQAVLSDSLLVGTLQVARLSRYFLEVLENVRVHFNLALLIQAPTQHRRLILACEVLEDRQLACQFDVVLVVDIAWQAGERQAELAFVLLPMLVVLDEHLRVLDAEMREKEANRLSEASEAVVAQHRLCSITSTGTRSSVVKGFTFFNFNHHLTIHHHVPGFQRVFLRHNSFLWNHPSVRRGHTTITARYSHFINKFYEL